MRYSSGGKEWRSICSLDLQKPEMDKAVFVKWPCKHCMDCVLCVHECVKLLYLRVEITLEVSTFMNTARHLATKSDIFHRTNKIQYFKFMLGIWWQKPEQNTSDQDCGTMIVNKVPFYTLSHSKQAESCTKPVCLQQAKCIVVLCISREVMR